MKQLIEVIKNEIEGLEKINLIRNQDKKQMTEWHYVTDKLPPKERTSTHQLLYGTERNVPC